MVSDSYRNRIGLEGRRGWRRWRRSWRSSSLDPSGGDGGDNSTLLGGSGGGGDPSGREEAQGDRGRTHKRRDLPRSSSGFAEMRGIEADIVEGMWGIEVKEIQSCGSSHHPLPQERQK